MRREDRKYLAGYIDFGILGKREVFVFRNDRRENNKQPAFRLMIREGDSWKEVGAFWVREANSREDVDEVKTIYIR